MMRRDEVELSNTILPSDFFGLRQAVPLKGSRNLLYPLTLIVYLCALGIFVYLLIFELSLTTVETVIDSQQIDAWTCSMASVVSQTVNIPIVQSYDTSYDLININDFTPDCNRLLSSLDPCEEQSLSISLNSTLEYDLEGVMLVSSAYPEDFAVFGMYNPNNAVITYYSLEISSGTFTTVLAELFGFYPISYSCSGGAVTYPDTVAIHVQSGNSKSRNIYSCLTLSTLYLLENMKAKAVTLSHFKGTLIAQITNDNTYNLYALGVTSVETKHNTYTNNYYINRISMVNSTYGSASLLFHLNTTSIISISVYTNPATSITSVLYLTCNGLFNWTEGNSSHVMTIPFSFYTNNGLNGNLYNFGFLQFDPQLYVAYVSSLANSLRIDLKSSPATSTAIATLPENLCTSNGAAAVVLPNATLLFSCTTATTQLFSYNTITKDIVFLAKGYDGSSAGWYVCEDRILPQLSGLIEEEGNCSNNGLAWRTEYSGTAKLFVPALAKSYFAQQGALQCNRSILYPSICATVESLPPYICSRNIVTSPISALTTAVANTQVFIAIVFLILGFILSRHQFFKQQLQSGKFNTTATAESKDSKTLSPAIKTVAVNRLWYKQILQLLMPSDFFYMPLDFSHLANNLKHLYISFFIILAGCSAVFVYFLVTQLHVSTLESELQSEVITGGGWSCTMATYRTADVFSTANIEPQSSYSFLNLHELEGECNQTLTAINPCETSTIYNPAQYTPIDYTYALNCGSPFVDRFFFTCLESSQGKYDVAMWDMSTGQFTQFPCAISAFPLAKLLAVDAFGVGYYPPQASAEKNVVYNTLCESVTINQLPANTLIQLVTNDQKHNLYVASSSSLYRLVRWNRPDGTLTFNASLIFTSTSQNPWVLSFTGVSVYLHEKDTPAVYYASEGGIGTTSTRYTQFFQGVYTNIVVPVYTRGNAALNSDGTALIIPGIDERSIWSIAINTTSFTFGEVSVLTTLNASQDGSSLYWLSTTRGKNSSLLYGTSSIAMYDFQTNQTEYLYTFAPNARIGWVVCGSSNVSVTQLPASLTTGAVSCPLNGIEWSLTFQDSYVFSHSMMNSFVLQQYQEQCPAILPAICRDVGLSPPYICTRNRYNSLSTAFSTAFAISQLVFVVSCTVVGAVILWYRKHTVGSSATSSSNSSAFWDSLFLPNAFFNIKQHRKEKAPITVLFTCMLIVVLATAFLFSYLWVTMQQETNSELEISMTDLSVESSDPAGGGGGASALSSSAWTCEMASKVTTSYALDDTTSSNMFLEDTAQATLQQVDASLLLVNVQESGSSCHTNLAQADFCAFPANVSLGYSAITSSIVYTGSVWSSKTDTLYFVNYKAAIPFRYNPALGRLQSNMFCALTAVTSGSMVALSHNQTAYFIALSGMVTYDCDKVTVLNATFSYFSSTSSLLAAAPVVKSLPTQLLSDPRQQETIACYTSHSNTFSQCYALTYVNKTLVTLSAHDIVLTTTSFLTKMASCRRETHHNLNDTQGYEKQSVTTVTRYLAYTAKASNRLYLLVQNNVSSTSGKGSTNNVYVVTTLATTQIQFDPTCQFLYYAAAACSNTGLQRVNITNPSHLVTTTVSGPRAVCEFAMLFSYNDTNRLEESWKTMTSTMSSNLTTTDTHTDSRGSSSNLYSATEERLDDSFLYIAVSANSGQPPTSYFHNPLQQQQANSEVMYLGYQDSQAAWFVCGNETRRNVPPLAYAYQGGPFCGNNGIGVSFTFADTYFFTTAQMTSYMQRYAQEYCVSYNPNHNTADMPPSMISANGSTALYSDICTNRVANLPPYLCSRTVHLSFYKILSIAVANAHFFLLVTLAMIGYVLPVMMRYWYSSKTSSSSSRTMNADGTTSHENTKRSENIIEMVAEGCSNDEETEVTVENPLSQKK